MRLKLIPATIVLYLAVSLAKNSVEESCTTSRELEDQCAAVCYPTVKPLLRYMEVCEKHLKLSSQMQDKLQAQSIELIKCKENVTTHIHNVHNSEDLCNLHNIFENSFKEVEKVNSRLYKAITELQSMKYEELSGSYEELSKEFNNYKKWAKEIEKENTDLRNEFARYEKICEREVGELKPTEKTSILTDIIHSKTRLFQKYF
ncbi:uncharacterized protein LOC116803599 [Drosophila sechellia]|uniref:uncharacterized protein LOC116803599 n=1 Tax=Drosophila sechellia TaxID=7238 RepID=UPI0013DE114C|nr:uncharacterized protein LOC116803599 [Drosophila sechellia]